MSFRKRNTILSVPKTGENPGFIRTEKQLAPGLRPSPLDGRLTTSTGTSSLDYLLAGHIGLPLGSSLLVEEQGTTDFSGVLLRYYAAEGLVQGHQVHVLGLPQVWKHELPAVADPKSKGKLAKTLAPADDQLKIAWRYKALGNNLGPRSQSEESSNGSTFCHSFDLTKRLSSASIKGSLHTVAMPNPLDFSQGSAMGSSPFRAMITHLERSIAASGPGTIHRIVVPSLLSPNMYAPGCSQPAEVLQFLHALRALLRKHSAQVSAIITLPVSLYPRGSGLTRWIELLCDGVVELVPSTASPGVPPPSEPSKKDAKDPEKGQGFLQVHSLPVYHEKGGGGAETTYFRENLSFSLRATKGLVIKPYSLPPLGEESQKEKTPASTVKDGMDF